MDRLFYPTSVAIIGASNTSGKIGNIILKNIIESGYKGKIWPINPKHSEVLGYESHSSVFLLKEIPDLVIVAIKAEEILAVIDDLGKLKIKLADGSQLQQTYVVVISAGFSEFGKGGLELEQKLMLLCKKYSIELVGPNCLGLMSLGKSEYSFNGTFDFAPKFRGNVALVSQSGALISVLLENADYFGFGFSKVISLGNKAGINETELLEYLDSDPETEVIGMYLESFKNGKEFYKQLNSCRKPVIILKPGKTEASKKAASSHTGAIAGNSKVTSAFLSEAGAIEVTNLEEMIDCLNLFSKYKSVDSDLVSVVTNAGGVGVMTLDALENTDLKITKLQTLSQTKLAEILPGASSKINPIDLLGDAGAGRYENVLETLLTDIQPDSLIVILTPQVNTEILETAKVLVDFADKFKNTVILPVFAGRERLGEAHDLFKQHNLPYFQTPERAVKALNYLYKYSQSLLRKRTKLKDIEPVTMQSLPLDTFTSSISEFENVMKLAKKYSINVPKYINLKDSKHEEIFDLLGSPVVLKCVNGDILHRTENNMVRVGVDSIAQIQDFVQAHQGLEIIAQESVEKGIEVFCGIQNDVDFGLVMVLGSGGIYAEAIDDFAMGPLPKSKEEVLKILQKTKVYKILNGFRGSQFALDELLKCLLSLAELARTLPVDFKSIDINPCIVTKNDYMIVDFKIQV